MIGHEQKCEICGYLVDRYKEAAKAQGLSGMAAGDEVGFDMPAPQDKLCTGCRRALKAAREQRARQVGK
jgi:hypothetical protein